VPQNAPVAAVFNTSPDTVELLRVVLQEAGFLVVSAFTFDIRDGRVDLEAFLRQTNPAVVIYDVAPPYDANWNLFKTLRDNSSLQHYHFVLTSTNAPYVQCLAGDIKVHEVIGKPYDLDQIVRAATMAVAQIPAIGRRSARHSTVNARYISPP
jgi:DNA-binding response OmpR family regulator